MDALLAFDRGLFLWINRTWTTPTFDPLWIVITLWGSGPPLLLWALPFRQGRRLSFLLTLLLLGLLVGAATQTIKFAVARPRPALVEKRAARTPFRRLTQRSFPSGHSSLVFAAALFLSRNLHPAWGLFWLLASLVALSRIVLGVHYPLDVLAGAALGLLVALLFERSLQRYLPSLLKKNSEINGRTNKDDGRTNKTESLNQNRRPLPSGQPKNKTDPKDRPPLFPLKDKKDE